MASVADWFFVSPTVYGNMRGAFSAVKFSSGPHHGLFRAGRAARRWLPSLVLGYLDGRFDRGIGELVDRLAMAVVERDEQRVWTNGRHDERLQLHRRPWRTHAHALVVVDAKPGRRLGVDLDPRLGRLAVEEPEAAGLVAAQVVVDDPTGGQTERKVATRLLGRRGMFDGKHARPPIRMAEALRVQARCPGWSSLGHGQNTPSCASIFSQVMPE